MQELTLRQTQNYCKTFLKSNVTQLCPIKAKSRSAIRSVVVLLRSRTDNGPVISKTISERTSNTKERTPTSAKVLGTSDPRVTSLPSGTISIVIRELGQALLEMSCTRVSTVGYTQTNVIRQGYGRGWDRGDDLGLRQGFGRGRDSGDDFGVPVFSHDLVSCPETNCRFRGRMLDRTEVIPHLVERHKLRPVELGPDNTPLRTRVCYLKPFTTQNGAQVTTWKYIARVLDFNETDFFLHVRVVGTDKFQFWLSHFDVCRRRDPQVQYVAALTLKKHGVRYPLTAADKREWTGVVCPTNFKDEDVPVFEISRKEMGELFKYQVKNEDQGRTKIYWDMEVEILKTTADSPIYRETLAIWKPSLDDTGDRRVEAVPDVDNSEEDEEDGQVVVLEVDNAGPVQPPVGSHNGAHHGIDDWTEELPPMREANKFDIPTVMLTVPELPPPTPMTSAEDVERWFLQCKGVMEREIVLYLPPEPEEEELEAVC